MVSADGGGGEDCSTLSLSRESRKLAHSGLLIKVVRERDAGKEVRIGPVLVWIVVKPSINIAICSALRVRIQASIRLAHRQTNDTSILIDTVELWAQIIVTGNRICRLAADSFQCVESVPIAKGKSHRFRFNWQVAQVHINCGVADL